jgi:phosphoglycolate phosphatase-like HAD superfamily hydrolase
VKLVLFDIDGTIMITNGAGRRAVHRALLEVFGTIGTSDHRFDGKTDPQIVRELMRIAGHGDETIDARMERMLERYVTYLHEELASPGHRAHVFPGVPELIEALDARGDALLGLLTGNLAAGARAKLAAVGIDPDRFRIGAFGSDHELRGELPAIAQRRAYEALGVDIPGHDVIVIGDTPADVDCGRAIGARAIGVATGHYDVAALAAHGAAAVFEDLSDTARVLDVIFAPSFHA